MYIGIFIIINHLILDSLENMVDDDFTHDAKLALYTTGQIYAPTIFKYRRYEQPVA